jgi:hypothetical protein
LKESLRVQPDEIFSTFYDFNNARIEILILNVRHGTLNFVYFIFHCIFIEMWINIVSARCGQWVKWRRRKLAC